MEREHVKPSAVHTQGYTCHAEDPEVSLCSVGRGVRSCFLLLGFLNAGKYCSGLETIFDIDLHQNFSLVGVLAFFAIGPSQRPRAFTAKREASSGYPGHLSLGYFLLHLFP